MSTEALRILDTPEAVERAGVGLWFDESGHPWNHTEDGDWIDRKGDNGDRNGPQGSPSAGITKREMQLIFLAQAGLRRERPSLAQRLVMRLRPNAVLEHRRYLAYSERYAQAGHPREQLGLAKFAVRLYRLRARRRLAAARGASRRAA